MIRFGDGPISKLWFNSIDRLIESFMVFAGCRSGASLGKDVRCKERKKTKWLHRGILGKGTCKGYREYSGDPIALYVVRARRVKVLLWRGIA